MFVSSHLMSEMALTAEHLIVVGRGRLIADTTRRGVRPRSASANAVAASAARTPRGCATALAGPDVTVSSTERRRPAR